MGTTMLCFFFFISLILLTLPSQVTVPSIFPKLSFLFFSMSMFYIWCDLKKKSKVLIEMYDEIRQFEAKHCSKSRKFTVSLIIFFVLFIATYVSMILISTYDQNMNRVLEPIWFHLTFKEHTYVSALFTSGFMYGVQFISFEISFKYYRVLKHCNRFINMFVPFNPNFVIRHQIDSVIHDFDETRQKFTETIGALNRLICVMIFSVNTVCLSIYINHIDANINYTLIWYFNIITINSYFIITRIILYIECGIEDILINTIILWRNQDHIGNPFLVVVVNNP